MVVGNDAGDGEISITVADPPSDESGGGPDVPAVGDVGPRLAAALALLAAFVAAALAGGGE